MCKTFCKKCAEFIFQNVQKKKRSRGCQSLILLPLLENNINQKMGTSCLNPKSICKNFCKYCAKICEKNCVEILQTAYFAKNFAIQTM